jgi:hypothetical protein
MNTLHAMFGFSCHLIGDHSLLGSMRCTCSLCKCCSLVVWLWHSSSPA